ncbi:MAG TPA: hypothetical protein VMB78_05675, partial [Dissulfurispiraceae bacterium]|nr:hypothetical protein [Dissulfurispiraceae bacterium]
MSQLKEALSGNLRLDFFEDDEIRSILNTIDLFDPALRQKTLALCLSLSHASSSFVVSTLRRLKKAAEILPLKDMEKWLINAFDLLDSRGIDSFIAF